MHMLGIKCVCMLWQGPTRHITTSYNTWMDMDMDIDIDMHHDQRSINVSLVVCGTAPSCSAVRSTSCKSCVPPSIAGLAHDRGEARQWSRELRPCSRQAMLLRCARLLRRDTWKLTSPEAFILSLLQDVLGRRRRHHLQRILDKEVLGSCLAVCYECYTPGTSRHPPRTSAAVMLVSHLSFRSSSSC